MGTGRGRALDEEVYACARCKGDLDGAVLVSVSWSIFLPVCVCSVMILAVLMHGGNGAC